ncbi:MAG TPA: phenylalanine--tRNA ligase subunit alpha [Synergistaceae bacterium]|nr:phenylalanine--tRNA ligase subunit alpha [Synergistaceae bacterium]HPJ24650.1 phenylalanine--tRNA ligase subunit alpha [Synergistaceae bacterium]HPQ36155.1 phenylalanine--tRNA ligase subunit alpha [Synergistaceae bacterium]
MGATSKMKEVREEFLKALEKAQDIEMLQGVKNSFLGKKGEITRLMKNLGTLSAEERPAFGKRVNLLRDECEELFESKKKDLETREHEKQEMQEFLDVTLPASSRGWGSWHPVVQVTLEVVEIFAGLGFTVASGPEIEDDFHNFEALNIPPSHPARDMQDTFYVEQGLLLRTHTSPGQVRAMKQWGAPLRIVCPGRVFRRDSDPTHSPMFNQLEGLLVDENISIADLKGCLDVFAREIFGRALDVRYRASYFPFTEPSLEMDISCVICGGKDKNCRVCKGTGWLEICGLGMVHPNVLRHGGIDPEKYSGFAWGMGLDRIAMLKYEIGDLRLLFEGDMGFLTQERVK